MSEQRLVQLCWGGLLAVEAPCMPEEEDDKNISFDRTCMQEEEEEEER